MVISVRWLLDQCDKLVNPIKLPEQKPESREEEPPHRWPCEQRCR